MGKRPKARPTKSRKKIGRGPGVDARSYQGSSAAVSSQVKKRKLKAMSTGRKQRKL